MRILIVGINYFPELTGIGKYTGEMAEWLAARGHEIRTITALPYYPDWRIWKGYPAWRYRKACLKGVTIYRCPLWVPRQVTGLKRLIHLASFALSSLPVLMFNVFWRPQIVLDVAPAFFTAPSTLLAARLSGAKSWLHIQDFEVDAAFSLGILKSPFLRAIVHFFETAILQRYNIVSTISNRMLDNAGKKGVKKSRALLFPNWVDTELIRPLNAPSPMRKELGISEDKVVALYAGNMGKKHGLEMLIDVARKLESQPGIQFVMCGEGVAHPVVQSVAADLFNVHCLPLQPTDKLNDLLNLADIHLLPQRSDTSDFVMPSRLTGMLASGKPVVTTAHPDSEVTKVVKSCGMVVQPEDADAFVEALIWLTEHPEERKILGKAGRKFAIQNFNKEKILGDFENRLVLSVRS